MLNSLTVPGFALCGKFSFYMERIFVCGLPLHPNGSLVWKTLPLCSDKEHRVHSGSLVGMWTSLLIQDSVNLYCSAKTFRCQSGVWGPLSGVALMALAVTRRSWWLWIQQTSDQSWSCPASTPYKEKHHYIFVYLEIVLVTLTSRWSGHKAVPRVFPKASCTTQHPACPMTKYPYVCPYIALSVISLSDFLCKYVGRWTDRQTDR